jgi:hypothetical protein
MLYLLHFEEKKREKWPRVFILPRQKHDIDCAMVGFFSAVKCN